VLSANVIGVVSAAFAGFMTSPISRQQYCQEKVGALI